MKKFLISILSIMMAFVFLFSACDCSNTEQTENPENTPTHDFTMTETDNFLVKNGSSEYVVVIPEKNSSYLRTAMAEFTYFFKMATNIDLKVVNDVGLTHSVDAKYISLGQTNLLKTCGVKTASYSLEKLSSDGGRIFTVDNTIYIVGGYDTGTLFAVYTFMNLTFNYESYYSSCIVIDKNVTEKKLMNYSVTDIPDFKGRSPGWGSIRSINFSEYDEVNFMYRMRYQNTYSENLFRAHQVYDDPNSPTGFSVDPSKAAIGTNTNTIINDVRTKPSHPSWFSDRGNQWCYTAHGDAEEFDLMTTAVTECIKYALVTYDKETYPLKKTISVTQEDNDAFCDCQVCSEKLAKYGTHVAAVIQFMNVVSDKVDAWLSEGDNQEKYGREDFAIEFFAYGPTEQPPVVLDSETNEWVPIDDSVIPSKNLIVNYANINIDYQLSPYAEDNKWGDDNLNGWLALTNRYSYFVYTTQRRQFNYFFDSFNHYTAEGFQYYAERGAEHMYVEGQTNNPTPSCWSNLKVYLQAKLQWNCYLDEEELTNNFFEAMYGPGASYMREFFEAERMYCYNEYKRVGFYKRWSIYNYVNEECEWPVAVVQSWIDYCDKALKAIEPLKNSDPEAYDNYYKHIEMEVVSPIVIMFEQNYSSMSQSTKDGYLNRLRNDMSRWDFSKMLIIHVAYGTPTMLPEWVEIQGNRL